MTALLMWLAGTRARPSSGESEVFAEADDQSRTDVTGDAAGQEVWPFMGEASAGMPRSVEA